MCSLDFSGRDENFTAIDSPPHLCAHSPPHSSLQELICVLGSHTTRKLASVSILAINFPGMLHVFFQQGMEQHQQSFYPPGQGAILQEEGPDVV